MSTDTPSVTHSNGRCQWCGWSQPGTSSQAVCRACRKAFEKGVASVGEAMAPSAQPRVTVVGTLEYDEVERWWHVVLNTRPDRDLDIETGDEVEVTLRRHERTTGSAVANEGE